MKTFINLTMFLLCINIVNAQWQNTITSIRNVESLSSDGSSIIAGTDGYGLLLTSNNGNSWTAINNGISNYQENDYTDVLINSTNFYSASWDNNYGGRVYLSTDNGNQWTIINNGMPYLPIVSLGASGSNIFAGSIGGGVFLSMDNGYNWTSINNGIPIDTTIFAFLIDGTNIFAGGVDGIYLSTNNGSSWTHINNGTPMTFINEFSKMGNTIFACGVGGIYQTNNNGNSWTLISSSLLGNYVKSIKTFGTNIFAANNDGIYLSADTGGTWTDVSNGLPVQRSTSCLAICGTYIFLGDSEGVWRRPISEMVNIKVNNNYSHINIFPNPSDGEVNISYSAKIKSIEIINVLGNSVFYHEPNNLQSNEVINIKCIQKGIYFVKIDNGVQIHTEKIIIN